MKGERGWVPLHMLSAAAATTHAASGSSVIVEYVLLFVVFAAVIYFTSIAPQRKKDREWKDRMSHLKRGVRVLTRGGLYGLVTDVKDEIVTVRLTDKVEVKVARPYIAEVLRGGAERDRDGDRSGDSETSAETTGMTQSRDTQSGGRNRKNARKG